VNERGYLSIGGIRVTDALRETLRFDFCYGSLRARDIAVRQPFFIYATEDEVNERRPLRVLQVDGAVVDGFVQLEHLPDRVTKYKLDAHFIGGMLKYTIELEMTSFSLGFDEDVSTDEDVWNGSESVDPSALQLRQWDLLAKLTDVGSVSWKETERVCFIRNEETSTEASIWRDKTRCKLIVAFRGTADGWKDFVTDSLVFQHPFVPGSPVDLSSSETKESPYMVHYGFLRAYASIQSSLKEILEGLVSKMNGNACEILVTGHSLGGALANLAAVDWAGWGISTNIHVCTFGTPRVGNARFASHSNEVIPKNFRVVNDRDVVPRMPTGDYHHPGCTVMVNSNRKVRMQQFLLRSLIADVFVTMRRNIDLDCFWGLLGKSNT